MTATCLAASFAAAHLRAALWCSARGTATGPWPRLATKVSASGLPEHFSLLDPYQVSCFRKAWIPLLTATDHSRKRQIPLARGAREERRGCPAGSCACCRRLRASNNRGDSACVAD